MPVDFFTSIEESSEKKQSLLCVGLDPRIETGEGSDIQAALLQHNRRIIEETCEFAACYKPNIAFYEAFGPQGLEALRKTLELIPADTPVLVDAKRNDIGATAAAYARSLFAFYGADGITVNPYLGKDSLDPFLAYPGKGLFALCRTSNPGSRDVQMLAVGDGGRPLYLEIAAQVASWGAPLRPGGRGHRPGSPEANQSGAALSLDPGTRHRRPGRLPRRLPPGRAPS